MRKIIILILSLNIYLNLAYGQNNFLPEYTYLISGNNVNVREDLNDKSRVLIKLKIADRVKIIKKSNIEYKNRSIAGKWVLIDTNYTKTYDKKDTYKGWVLDYYLIGNDDFKVVKDFYDLKLEGYYGDYYICYEFKKDGSYKQIYYDLYNDPQKRNIKHFYGKLYGYKNIFITRSIIGIEIFYMSKNKICVAYTNVCVEIK